MLIRNRSIYTVLALLSLSALLVSGCSNSSPTSAQADQTQSVKVIKIGDNGDSGLSGQVAADQQVQVVSKITGKVAAVNVDEGAKVKKGDVLVQLETNDFVQQVNQAQAGLAAAQAKLADTAAGARPQEIQGLQSAVQAAQAAVDQAKTSLDHAKAAYDLAQTTFDRKKSLHDSGVISQADFDQATLDLNTAKTGYEQSKAQLDSLNAQLVAAQAKLDLAKAGPTQDTINALQASVDSSQASLELAKNALDNAAIKAPLDGIVVKRSIDPGEMAQPGAPLLTVVSMDVVQIQVSVPQDKIALVKQGSSLDVKVNDTGDKYFQGTVDFVSPVADATSNTFPVKLKLKNPDGQLRAGALAQVFITSQQNKGFELPKTALVNKNQKTYVYKVNSGVVHLIEVQTEDKDQNTVYVKSGAQMGDQIVTNPSDRLSDGTKVKVD